MSNTDGIGGTASRILQALGRAGSAVDVDVDASVAQTDEEKSREARRPKMDQVEHARASLSSVSLQLKHPVCLQALGGKRDHGICILGLHKAVPLHESTHCVFTPPVWGG